MTELVCLELSVVLWFVHIFVQAGFGNALLPPGYLFTSRDQPPQPRGVMFGRATRALANYVENLAPFVAVDLALFATHHDVRLWPTLWIVARALYIPLYVFGVVYARTAAWALSVVALLLMLLQLAF